MVECPGEVFISVLLFEFRVKQCCALHGEVLHPLYFQFVCTSRHVRLVTVLIVEIPDTEIGNDGLAHLLRLFVKFRKDFGLQLLLFGGPPPADKLAELRVLPETVEPVRIDVRRHIEAAVYHELGESVAVRSALVIVPTLVKVPDRSEEDFVHSAPLIEISAGITIHIAREFLHDDEIRQCLLIEPLSPAIDRVSEIG